MQLLIRLIFLVSFAGVACAEYELPSSGDPEVFQQEVKNYIITIAENGINVDRDSKAIREKIAGDEKDWETPLGEIIGNPRKYFMGPTNVALSAAAIRKDKAEPKINEATARLFRELVPMAIELFDQRPDNAALQSGINSWIGGLIIKVIELDSPDALQSILEFLHSPEVDRFDTLQQYSPKYIAPALQKYGDLRNAEEAMKVAAKLESIGRADVASDIKRAAERIMKDAAEKQAVSPGGVNGSSRDARGTDNGDEDADRKPLWPWLAAGVALIAAVVAYSRMRHAQT